jgi:hypothetical protein
MGLSKRSFEELPTDLWSVPIDFKPHFATWPHLNSNLPSNTHSILHTFNFSNRDAHTHTYIPSYTHANTNKAQVCPS